MPNLVTANLNGCTSLHMGCIPYDGENGTDFSSGTVGATPCSSLSVSEISALSASLRSEGAALTELELQGTVLGSKGASMLAAGLKDHSKLTSLSVASCRLGGSGLQSLLRELPSSLMQLDLRHNYIDDDGAKVIASTLKAAARRLNRLDIGWNGVGARGARALAEALRMNPELTDLSLSWNAVKDRGAKALGDALSYNHKLTTLNLDHNAIKDAGAAAIAKGLKDNSVMRNVEIAHNGVSLAMQQKVREALLMIPKPVEKVTTPPSDEDSDEIEEISFDEDEEEPSPSSKHDEL
eukprot:CAMPEP_0119324834 /NCGR_PEP_ID=MMETSP1333-20130426/64310_1 /TAXON_ID=418940 /ORGANISM="Scyphosphaera apsteinii, Strain RCC1455" /LENGTH=294 /DNA_ID=CAMNT_0007332639 /DNA_START=150 /DNA_END=1034 /DNA_ORIENTATION=-